MKTTDFLAEAGLKSKDFYERFRLQNLIDKLENNKTFLTTTGKKIKVPATSKEISYLKSLLKNNFDRKDTNPKARSFAPVTVPSEIGGVKISSLAKTNEFGGTLGLAKKGQLDYTKANLGPTVEALKSFAIYAKLTMRDKSEITAEDVIKIAKLAADNSKEEPAGKSNTPTTLAVYSKNVPDVGRQVKDKMELRVALSTPSFQRAVRATPADKSAWGNLQGIVNYVNTESDINKYNRYFTTNNIKDPIQISVVGIGGAKTDIQTTYAPDTPNAKPIKNLTLSVKSAGAEWYDQASGNNAAGVKKFYNIIGLGDSLADQLMQQIGFVEGGMKDTLEQFNKRVEIVTDLYIKTEQILKNRIAQLNDKGEADYIHYFIGQLKNSLAGDETLVYVKFDANGTYEKLKPNLLSHLSKIIDLDVKITMVGRPRITWIDKNTGKELIYVVLLKNPPNRRLTHQFNLGKHFFELMKDAGKKEVETQPDSADVIATPAPQQNVSSIKTPAKATSKLATPTPKRVAPAPQIQQPEPELTPDVEEPETPAPRARRTATQQPSRARR